MYANASQEGGLVIDPSIEGAIAFIDRGAAAQYFSAALGQEVGSRLKVGFDAGFKAGQTRAQQIEPRRQSTARILGTQQDASSTPADPVQDVPQAATGDVVLDRDQLEAQWLAENEEQLERSIGEDTARGSVALNWRKDAIFGPGLVFAPFALARGDIYRVETSPNHNESFSRGLGYAGTEVSWPFMRPGENVDLIVEPVVMAAYATDYVEKVWPLSYRGGKVFGYPAEGAKDAAARPSGGSINGNDSISVSRSAFMRRITAASEDRRISGSV